MKTITTFIFLVFQVTSFAQETHKKDLCKDWKIKSGWFGDEKITLEVLNKTKEKELVQLLLFKSDGSLKEELYNPEHLGMCGNGILYFESATWRLAKNEIVFDIKGGRMADSTFHYIMTYEIVSNVNGKIVLQKSDVQLNEVKKYD